MCHMPQGTGGNRPCKGGLSPDFPHKSPHSDGSGTSALPNMSLQGQGQQGDFARAGAAWRL